MYILTVPSIAVHLLPSIGTGPGQAINTSAIFLREVFPWKSLMKQESGVSLQMGSNILM